MRNNTILQQEVGKIYIGNARDPISLDSFDANCQTQTLAYPSSIPTSTAKFPNLTNTRFLGILILF